MPTDPQIQMFASWLEAVDAEQFRVSNQDSHHRAWNQMWEAAAILLRLGAGISDRFQMLANIIKEMDD